jgi:hypothetical protein
MDEFDGGSHVELLLPVWHDLLGTTCTAQHPACQLQNWRITEFQGGTVSARMPVLAVAQGC